MSSAGPHMKTLDSTRTAKNMSDYRISEGNQSVLQTTKAEQKDRLMAPIQLEEGDAWRAKSLSMLNRGGKKIDMQHSQK